ncbi:MAG: TonB-dependent receptor domain-containing protein [Acidobacteriota bacterium]
MNYLVSDAARRGLSANRLAFYCPVFFLLVAATWGQTFTGTVLGRVTDSQQAVIVGGVIILHSGEQGFERRTTTNSHGEYEFRLVPPGRFTLRIEAARFAPTTVSVEVVVATPVRADLTLQIQALRHSVNVFGENGVAVQTENADLGRTINPHEMSELPSLTRSPYDFIALIPGATLSNDALGVGFAVNGGRTQSANYLLDGSENNDTLMSAPGQNVPLDSVEEFTVQTNHYSAEYGRNSGFTANIVTKAGTNQFHGSLYDYIRNSVLSANTYNNNANGFPRPVFNRDQFGGTLGGPIRHGKLFFFASVEPILVRSSTTTSFFVPTPQLLSISAPGTEAIFQRFPLPGDLSPTNVRNATVCPFGATCGSGTSAGLVTVPAFASTSRVGPQDAGAGPPQNTVLATGRLDWVVNSKMQAFARYAFEDKHVFATVIQPYSSQLDVPLTARNQNIALNLIGTWTPRVATESRIVYSRIVGDPERFGGDNPSAPELPIPAFSLPSEPGVILPSGTAGNGGPQNFYQVFQAVTWAHGHHTLKFGGQFVHLRQNYSLGFAVGQVADATFPDTQAFVNGVVSFYSIAVNPKGHFPGEFVDPPFGPPSFKHHFHYNEPGLFLTDIWKVTPRLTLTPGLRWEYFGVLHSPGSEHRLDSNFYFASESSYLERIAKGTILRTIDAPGSLRGRFYRPDYRNFAPRLGIAFDLFGDGKTVVRAGAGVFYDRHVGWELFRTFLNPPSYSLTVLEDVPVTAELVDNQYAAFPNTSLQMSKSDTSSIDPDIRSAYTLSWNGTIERELKKFVIGASYLGSSGSRLYSTYRPNRLGSGGLLDPSCITTRLAADGITSLGPYYKSCPELNPDLTDLRVRSNGSHSSFAALELRLDTRSVWGAVFGVNYTWSHSVDNSSVSALSASVTEVGGNFLDAFNPSADRGSSDFDVRHRIAARWIWEFPLGKTSKQWKMRYLMGGWEISGLLSYQTGQPFTIGDTGVPDFREERTRPRLTGTVPRVGPLIPDAVSPNTFLYLPINQVYDPANGKCIANTTPFACEISVNGPFDGILPRNTFRQPGLYYQDTALLKNILLPRDGMKLQFRVEFYNLFNHPNLYINAGTNDVNASTFTRSDSQLVPGVTASFKGNRQIVLAVKFIF